MSSVFLLQQDHDREAFAWLRLADPSFPATVYARLIEGENGTHDLIWSRSKPKVA
ncbi:DUF736 family protein [Pseudomonas aeruginosa]